MNTHKILYFLLLNLLLFSCRQDGVVIEIKNEIPGIIQTPVSIEIDLNESQLHAIKEGRLMLVDSAGQSVPVQLETTETDKKADVILILPEGTRGRPSFKLVESEWPVEQKIEAYRNAENKQVAIVDNHKKVLQYNYETVYESDVIRPESQKNREIQFSVVGGIYYDEYLKAHPELQKNDTTTSRIYAVPRSDYIHPLYGLNGEMLTNDWPDGGHPHHRGIFWAWPEVEYNGQLGDIYALQRVFARPTGNIELISGTVFADIKAENLWMWEDKEAIVRENVKIRAYRATKDSRVIDLTIKLLALKDSVTIATRFTNSYGGLNIRMQTPENQDISYYTDSVSFRPRRAWSDFNGIFEGNEDTSGLMVLQHSENPEYPGEWREYPNLAWVQPTFPTPHTRYELKTTESLILRYRFIVHNGGKPDFETSSAYWHSFQEMN